MDATPPPGLIDGSTVGVGFYLHPVMVLAVVALVVMYVVLMWAIWRTDPRGERVRCPVYGRRATVVFRRAVDGTRVEVRRCSLLGEGPVSCRQRCLGSA